MEIDEYNNINLNQELFVNQSNASLKIWAIITIIIFLFTINQLVFDGTIELRTFIYIFIILLTILLLLNLNTKHGFVLTLVLLLVVFLIRIL
jgi:hypothetical protein